MVPRAARARGNDTSAARHPGEHVGEQERARCCEQPADDVAGDEALRALADSLRACVRAGDIPCRLGGDEFAVLLVETPKAGAQIYADRIRHVLEHHVFPHGQRISASFGIATLPEDVGAASEDLLRAADEALYAAKRAGKNRVSVHEDVALAQPAASETKVE